MLPCGDAGVGQRPANLQACSELLHSLAEHSSAGQGAAELVVGAPAAGLATHAHALRAAAAHAMLHAAPHARRSPSWWMRGCSSRAAR
jgi:hypothetical protein